jgi:hypothetical protein
MATGVTGARVGDLLRALPPGPSDVDRRLFGSGAAALDASRLNASAALIVPAYCPDMMVAAGHSALTAMLRAIVPSLLLAALTDGSMVHHE